MGRRSFPLAYHRIKEGRTDRREKILTLNGSCVVTFTIWLQIFKPYYERLSKPMALRLNLVVFLQYLGYSRSAQCEYFRYSYVCCRISTGVFCCNLHLHRAAHGHGKLYCFNSGLSLYILIPCSVLTSC